MSINGDYLMMGGRDAIEITLDNSRRARGIDVWAALKSLGRKGLAELVDRNCDQAQWLAAELRAAGVEVLNDVVLNQVVAAFGDDARTKRAVAAFQRDGRCWCGGTRWHGQEALRVSICSWATTREDMATTLEALLAAGAGAARA
jgi:glutamate/tyrosine decarboxylase-like PLP-dependent enzyme